MPSFNAASRNFFWTGVSFGAFLLRTAGPTGGAGCGGGFAACFDTCAFAAAARDSGAGAAASRFGRATTTAYMSRGVFESQQSEN
jgi:hypothetical protein